MSSLKIMQMLIAIKGETDSSTIILGDFKTLFTPMDRSPRQKIHEETQALSDTLDQIDLTDIYRTLHPNAEEYTSFSSAHGTFTETGRILSYKTLTNVK